jgi:hypothetical protein
MVYHFKVACGSQVRNVYSLATRTTALAEAAAINDMPHTPIRLFEFSEGALH